MTSSQPLAYQRVLPLRPELQPWRTLIRAVAIFVLIATCLQLTGIGMGYLSRHRVNAGLFSLNGPSSPLEQTIYVLLLIILVISRILSLIAAVGCLLLAQSFRLFLLLAFAISAGAELLMGGMQIYLMDSRRGWSYVGQVSLSFAIQSLYALILPTLVCFFLSQRATANAFASSRETTAGWPPRSAAYLILAWLGLLSGILGTFLKPILLFRHAVERYIGDLSPWFFATVQNPWFIWQAISMIVL